MASKKNPLDNADSNTTYCYNSFIPLLANFRKNGFEYTLERRGNRSFIFRQNVTPKIAYYEVFLLRISKNWTVNEVSIRSKEKFPKNEDFGKWAWTYRSLEKAMVKFLELEYENSCP